MKLEEEANSEIGVADTDSGTQVRRPAIWKTILRRRRRKKRNNDSSSSSKPQQKSP